MCVPRRRNDAKMGPKNLLHALTQSNEYNKAGQATTCLPHAMEASHCLNYGFTENHAERQAEKL